MKRLDRVDREIIRYLAVFGRETTANDIAEKTHTSWKTAQVHLDKLQQLGYVESFPSGKRKVWMLVDYS